MMSQVTRLQESELGSAAGEPSTWPFPVRGCSTLSSAASGKLQGQGKSKEPIVPKTCFQECFPYYRCSKVSMSEIQKNTNMQQCKQKKNTNHLHFQEPRDNLLSILVSTLSVFMHAYVCLFYKQKRDLCVCSVAQSCPNLSTPWTVAHQAPLPLGILQGRILECVAMPSSRGSSQPRDWTQISHIAGRFFTVWATRGALSLCKLPFSCNSTLHIHYSTPFHLTDHLWWDYSECLQIFYGMTTS